LSIDPDVAQTGQPYELTGDDPLNSTDPLGLAQNNKQIRKVIRGLERTVQKHVDKIRNNPGSRDVAHWQDEIDAAQERIERLSKRLPGNSAMVSVTPSAEMGPAQHAQQLESQGALASMAARANSVSVSVSVPALRPPPQAALGLLGTIIVGGALFLAFG